MGRYTHISYGTQGRRGKKKKQGRKAKKSKSKQQKTLNKKNFNALQHSVVDLYKRDDKKYYYVIANNALIPGGPSLNQVFPAIFPLANLPQFGATSPAGPPYPGFNTREEDSATANLRNIRIHMTIHASHPECYRTQKCYIALVKSRVGLGAPSGIVVPGMTQIWDYNLSNPAGVTQLLAPWELFRKTQGDGAQMLQDETFKILKSWDIYLQPQDGETRQSLRTTNTNPVPPNAETGTIISVPAPAIPLPAVNMVYGGNRKPCVVKIKYTHKCMNAKVDFIATDQSAPTNVNYFLVACGNGTATDRGFRLNAVVKVNFIDE